VNHWKILAILLVTFVGCQSNAVQYKLKDGNYLVKEPGDVWRCIMLPGTGLGFTVREITENGFGPAHKREGKEGRPSTLADVDELYLKDVRVLQWGQVSDGNYCVERKSPDSPPSFSPTWTVWSEELFLKVRETQGF